MKHAGAAAFAALEDLLEVIRSCTGMREPRPGVFYRKGKAWLHFHEDPAGIFADVKLDGVEFTRLRVSTAKEQAQLLRLVDRSAPG